MKPAKIYVGDVLDRSWRTAKKPIWLMTAVLLLGGTLATQISDYFLPNETLDKIIQNGKFEEMLTAMDHGLLAIIIIFLMQAIVNTGICRMVLEHSKGNNTYKLTEAYRYSMRDLLRFIGVSLLVSVITAIGYVLLVIPGIIASVYLLFAPYYVLEHPEAGITDALRKSKEMVTGNFMPLFSLGLISMLLIMVGSILFYIPAFLAQAYTYFMQADCYRQLTKHDIE